LKIKIVLLTALFLAFSSVGFARSKTKNVFALNLSAEADISQSGTESESYAGELQVGKTDSVILYVGMETGDYAAFCFKNDSAVGRAILAVCKNGEQCQFTGEVTGGECKVPGLEADLSASSKIVSIKSVKKLPAQSRATVKIPKASTTAVAPQVIIKNLYAAQKAGVSPFFQTKSRARVDKYFTKDFADLIWKDAVAAQGEVGAFEFDPLYNAQDTKITAFKIGQPLYGEGNLDVADVPVTFRNMGKDETVLFRLERNSQKIWKIGDIYYPSNPESSSSLKTILTGALKASEGNTAPKSKTTSGIRSVDFLNYSYQGSVCSEDAGLPGTVKVRNGKFKDRDSNFFDISKKEIVYGDVNGDGSEEAVVLIRCGSAAGTLRAFEVHAYSFQNGQAKLLARLDSTGVESDYQKSYPDGIVFYAGEHGPKIVNGHVIVEALTDGSFAGPENVATFDYQLSGSKFALNGKPTRTKMPE
jgi:hypothetical protein